MFQLIYELRKNCCGWTGGRVDGTGIEGSIRGPRGPKKFAQHMYGAFLIRCFFRAPSYDSPGHHGEECVKVCFGNFLFQMFFDHALSKAITKIKTRRFPRRNVTMWRNKSARKCPRSSVLQKRWSLVITIIIITIIIIVTIPHHKNSKMIITAPPRTTWA